MLISIHLIAFAISSQGFVKSDPILTLLIGSLV